MVECAPKPFFSVFSENTAFFEKIVEYKNIQHQISDRKGYIHFWWKMTPDRSHSDTVGRVTNKVGYFYGPKYRSSEALPAPEIFSSFCLHLRTVWELKKWAPHPSPSSFVKRAEIRQKIKDRNESVGFFRVCPSIYHENRGYDFQL